MLVQDKYLPYKDVQTDVNGMGMGIINVIEMAVSSSFFNGQLSMAPLPQIHIIAQAANEDGRNVPSVR